MQPAPNTLDLAAALVIGLASAAGVSAQNGPATVDRHVAHAGMFTEAPPQRAVLIPGTGAVHFPVTTGNGLAQQFFDQGIGQLHGFWFYEAERSFRQVAALDPDCAMAFWGMACANVHNPSRAVSFAWEAFQRRGKASARERMYIEAWARYLAAEKKPETEQVDNVLGSWRAVVVPVTDARRDRLQADLRAIAATFPDDVEARALLVAERWQDPREPTAAVRAENERLLADVLTAAPQHPAHHYRIHWAEDRPAAKQPLESAWRVGLAAPAIGHMWHMGGLVYSKLGRHADAAWAQEASARADHAHIVRTSSMPYDVHNYARNCDMLCRSLCQTGRLREAAELARFMIELPRHPKRADRSGELGRRRLLEALTLAERWDDVVEVAQGPFFASADPDVAAQRALALGWAFACQKRIEDARAELRKLVRIRGRRAQRSMLLTMLIRVVLGETGAIETLEGLGYSRDHLAVLSVEAGAIDKALELVRRKRGQGRAGTAVSLAIKAWTEWEEGLRDQAVATFAQLRASAPRCDLDLPPFARLAPIARAMGAPADWRIARASVPGESTAGESRPELESLGPARWSPRAAPPFGLPGGDGAELALSAYRGKPVLVVFFLGFGCLHCVEQLKSLAPRAADFEKAGISIVTIGTDTVAQVQASIQQGLENDDPPLPFPVLCDPKGAAFRTYGCWDDYDRTALHGTYLVDGKGLIRWQDISVEPFMETEFLLEECKRLLARPPQ